MELFCEPRAFCASITTSTHVVIFALLFIHCACAVTFYCPVCEPNTCDVTGSCIVGCYTGKYLGNGSCAGRCRINCEVCAAEVTLCVTCSSGYYGAECEFPCDSTCQDGRCNKQAGRCMEGLIVRPPLSSILTVGNTETVIDKTRIVVIWIAGTLIISVLLLVIGMIVFINCTRRRGLKDADDRHMYEKEPVPDRDVDDVNEDAAVNV